eukprot:scaffold3307_cov265-Pinguiococcus_pyrenoidosus.AAC.22
MCEAHVKTQLMSCASFSCRSAESVVWLIRATALAQDERTTNARSSGRFEGQGTEFPPNPAGRQKERSEDDAVLRERGLRCAKCLGCDCGRQNKSLRGTWLGKKISDVCLLRSFRTCVRRSGVGRKCFEGKPGEVARKSHQSFGCSGSVRFFAFSGVQRIPLDCAARPEGVQRIWLEAWHTYPEV